MLSLTFVGVAVGSLTFPPMANWESHGQIKDTDALLDEQTLDDDLIASVNNDPESTWTAGRNIYFEGRTLRETKKLMGTLQNMDESTFLPYKELAPVDIPDEFDWRTDARAAKCPSLKEVRDQANCGSCWAFGSVEAMTDRICIASGGSDTTHLSAQDVTSCCHLGDMGCNGGIPSTVYTYYSTSGIVDGGNFGDKSMCYSYQLAPCAHHTNSSKYQPCPAEVAAPKCAKSCIDDTKAWSGAKHRGGAGYSVCKQGTGTKCADQMKQEIYQNGPVTGMFFVHKSFTSYKSGVYQSKGLLDPLLGGHAIKIMGYGTENGTPYWLVANSWNSDWGMGGFFKIKRGANVDQIENPMINGGPVAGKAKTEDILV